jgi:tryptophan synthase alpha chain
MEIILYLSNGYPNLESSYQTAIEYADAGCKIIEIDFPSRNPYLEGEYIADRMKQALNVCDDYEKYMESIIAIKKRLPDIRFLLLAYENTVEEIGIEKFIGFCKQNGIEDILLVGLKDETIKNKIIASGLKVSCYVQYQMLQEEIDSAMQSNGFVYIQAKPGDEINPQYETLKDCIQHLRDCGIERPVYCGVGIHTPEDVKMAKEAGADAAFVGSTILKLHDNIPLMKETILEFKAQC